MTINTFNLKDFKGIEIIIKIDGDIFNLFQMNKEVSLDNMKKINNSVEKIKIMTRNNNNLTKTIKRLSRNKLFNLASYITIIQKNIINNNRFSIKIL